MTDDTEICGAECVDGSDCTHPAGSCPVPSHTDEDHTGPETKLTEERIDGICRHISEGKSVVSAARMNGVNPATVYSWLEKGEEQGPDESLYGEFRDRFVRARGLGEESYVSDIMEIAREEGDLETLMAMLKQRFPESWGEVDRGEQAGGVVVNTEAEDTVEIDPDSLEVINES